MTQYSLPSQPSVLLRRDIRPPLSQFLRGVPRGKHHRDPKIAADGSEKWGDLMIAAQDGQSEAYEQLLRELDAWLRRYYARRLPRAAAEDARQHVLLPFMPNGTRTRRRNPSDGIARYKWIDHIRHRMNVLKEITTDDKQDRH